MALTALQVFKYLPGGLKQEQANCKKCSSPTCMAFAMKIVKGQAEITACPYISDEAKAILLDSFKKPQKEISFGLENPAKIGDETVLFRHEKKFVNPSVLAVSVLSSEDYTEKINRITDYSIERVGEVFGISAINLVDANDGRFIEMVQAAKNVRLPIILSTNDKENAQKAADLLRDKKPMLDFDFAESNDLPFCVSASSSEEFAQKTSELLKQGLDNIILSLKTDDLKSAAKTLTEIRYESVHNKNELLGFPTMIKLDKIKDKFELGIFSSVLLCKYASVIVLPDLNSEVVSALLTLRQSIFTDPQVPLQVKPGLYEIGDVDEHSLVFVTTNFALTYFAMRNELESINLPSYLLITDSDGMSVLTAWSASKLTGEIVAKAVKDTDLENKIKHRDIIIPGFVDVLQKEIQQELPGWNIVIGCNEASDLKSYLTDNGFYSVYDAAKE